MKDVRLETIDLKSLLRKHFLKNLEDFKLSCLGEFSQVFVEPYFIYGAELIENHECLLSFKFARNSSRITSGFGGERRNDHGLNVIIHFIG